jgi:hypothetical protein
VRASRSRLDLHLNPTQLRVESASMAVPASELIALRSKSIERLKIPSLRRPVQIIRIANYNYNRKEIVDMYL